MERLKADTSEPMTPEKGERIMAANGIPPPVAKMTDGDLWITKAWAHQKPPRPFPVREIHYRSIPAKPAHCWLADLGKVLRWGTGLVAVALLLVLALDVGAAFSQPRDYRSGFMVTLGR
jgi:hypothetical protein